MDAVLGQTLASLTITDTQRPAAVAVEQAVVRPKVQVRLVEQQPDRNTAQLAVLAIAQLLIEWMQQPAVAALYLGGKGELIIFLRQTFAVFLDDLADGNTPEYRWRGLWLNL